MRHDEGPAVRFAGHEVDRSDDGAWLGGSGRLDRSCGFGAGLFSWAASCSGLSELDRGRAPAFAVLAASDAVGHGLGWHEHELPLSSSREATLFIAVDVPTVCGVMNLGALEVWLERSPALFQLSLGRRVQRGFVSVL
jgi:hypothetical protein